MPMLYRNFTTPTEVDDAYNIERFTTGFPGYIDRYAAESRRSREALNRDGRRYGEMLDERLEVFRSTSSTPTKPVVMLVHGGGWRMTQAEDYDFIALGLTGHAVVSIVNYTLAPQATFSEMVHQVRSSIAWTYRHAREFGGDPDRLYVVGHSAGAHLSTMAAMTDWHASYGLPASVVKAVVAISGIYDLRPSRYTTWLGPYLQLTGRDLVELSPMLVDLPRAAPPVFTTFGDGELPEFKRQAEDFSARWTAAGLMGGSSVQAGRDHFSVLLDLLTEDAPLTRMIIAFLEGRK